MDASALFHSGEGWIPKTNGVFRSQPRFVPTFTNFFGGGNPPAKIDYRKKHLSGTLRSSLLEDLKFLRTDFSGPKFLSSLLDRSQRRAAASCTSTPGALRSANSWVQLRAPARPCSRPQGIESVLGEARGKLSCRGRYPSNEPFLDESGKSTGTLLTH